VIEPANVNNGNIALSFSGINVRRSVPSLWGNINIAVSHHTLQVLYIYYTLMSCHKDRSSILLLLELVAGTFKQNALKQNRYMDVIFAPL
jgi:hypothetical protein